jgi:flagellar assembly protein FliH
VTTWRSHRFVPLADLMSSDAWQSGLPQARLSQLQATRGAEFQEECERGYREGFEKGTREGRESGLTQGRDEGFREGAASGKSAMIERFDSLARPVDAMLKSLGNLQADYHAALRKEVVDLVAKVARQVVRSELALKPAKLLKMVDETLATMPHAPDSEIVVYLNEGDLQRLREFDDVRTTQWNLRADPQLEPGECRVKCGTREADAGCHQRLAACMEQISAQLLPAAEASESPP